MTEKNQPSYSPIENYEKAAFQFALYEIALEEADLAMATDNSSDDLEKVALASMPRMLKTIEKYTRRASYVRFAKETLPKVGRAVSAFALFVLLSGSIAIASSKTVRASVIEFLIRTTPEYTAVGFYQTEDVIDVPENWGSSYYPTYIPAGFSIAQVNAGYGSSEVVYRNENGEKVSVFFGSISTQTRADSEMSETVHININGVDSVLIAKDGSHRLISQLGDEYYYISTTLPVSEVMRIAESIKLISR